MDIMGLCFQHPAPESHHRLEGRRGSPGAHGLIGRPTLPYGKASCHIDSLIIARMSVMKNKATCLISLTDTGGGVDEIQDGGGQRKQEYKSKE